MQYVLEYRVVRESEWQTGPTVAHTQGVDQQSGTLGGLMRDTEYQIRIYAQYYKDLDIKRVGQIRIAP